MKRELGLDIGGANLKMAHTSGSARSTFFALWKHSANLAAALRTLVSDAPAFDEVAITMTGELCDCFANRREGVLAILDAVEAALPNASVRIWRNDSRLVNIATARESVHEIASANWLALAAFASRYAPVGNALLLDMGSTTTDIIPIVDGKPLPQGRTDFSRLQSGELLYRGLRRTPFPWTLRPNLASELFATMLDAFLLTELVSESPHDCQTADGRPATKGHAHARIARMLGTDGEICPESLTRELALQATDFFLAELRAAIQKVCDSMSAFPCCVITAGAGESLLRKIVAETNWGRSAEMVSFKEKLGVELSQAACAYAVAILAAERHHGQ